MSNPSSPLLTICILTYNHGAYIQQALDGVMMQRTTFQWQLVIADDFSTDGTRDILLAYKKQYPEQIHLILQERNVVPRKTG